MEQREERYLDQVRQEMTNGDICGSDRLRIEQLLGIVDDLRDQVEGLTESKDHLKDYIGELRGELYATISENVRMAFEVRDMRTKLDVRQMARPDSKIPRPAVLRWADAMERRLQRNDGKPGWEGMTRKEKLEKFREEVAEVFEHESDPHLWFIMGYESQEEAWTHELEDVGNTAFFLRDDILGLHVEESRGYPVRIETEANVT